MLRERTSLRACAARRNQKRCPPSSKQHHEGPVPGAAATAVGPESKRTAPKRRIKEPGQHMLPERNFTVFIWVCGILCGVCRATVPARGEISSPRQNCDGLAELLGDIAQDKPIVSPSNLRKSLTKIAPQFRGNGQHDSQELLRCLLDGLAEDLKRPPPPSPVTLPRQENTEIVEEAHCEAWRAYINANASPVSDHFAGLLRSTVECCSCHCKSVRYDPYLDLSLPLPPPPSNVRSPLSAKLQKGSTSCTLEECLQRFTAVEDLTEKITCERCKKPRKSKSR